MGSPVESIVEFGWFGDLVRVRSDGDAATVLFRRLWGGSAPPAAPRAVHSYVVSLRPGTPSSISGPTGTRLLDSRFALWHAYNVVLRELAGTLGDRFLLHAASLARDGRAIAIVGPSGFGKTTLSLHLAFRGFTLLSDDMTALARGAAEIEALPRAVHMRGGSRATLSPSQIERLSGAVLHEDDDGWTVDARALRESETGPVPLRAVALLRSGIAAAPGPRTQCFDLWLAAGFEHLLAEIRNLPGVAEVGRSPAGAGAFRVRTLAAGPLAAWIRDRDPAVVAAAEAPSEKPDFASSPEWARIGPFEAAVGLCRGLLNRHAGSALDREFRDREALLVGEIAESLRGVALVALSPGRLEETVAMLQGMIETGDVVRER